MHFGAAVHESAHGVVGLMLGMDLEYLLIRPDGSGLTMFRPTRGEERSRPPAVPTPGQESETDRWAALAAYAELIDEVRADAERFDGFLQRMRERRGSDGITNELVMSKAGREAHARVTRSDDVADRAAGDLIEEDLLICALDDPRLMARVDFQTREKAARLVRQYWEAIVEVAIRLVECGRMEGDEVRAIVSERENHARS